MNHANLKLIRQPAWKVLVIDLVARILGILVKVEGIPVGSVRNLQTYVRNTPHDPQSNIPGGYF